MPHNYLKSSVEKQTGRTGILLVITFLGGFLVIDSFLFPLLFEDPAGPNGQAGPIASVLGLAGAILLGAPIIVHAVGHLWSGHKHMDELIALALLAAIAAGKYQEAGVIAFFVAISNLIETRTALGARAAIESLIRLAPTRANKVSADGTERSVEARDLVPGDLIRIRPGDGVPADGEIVSGATTANQANVTGESMPVEKQAGDQVFSGTMNLTGAIDVRVTRIGPDTTLGRVQTLILQAEASKTPAMRLVDQYAAWYTPTVLMLAMIVLFFTRQVDRAIAMLVVACPCAIILAAPTAMVAALSCAARLGVLIKKVTDLELARNITAVVFDKTGTLTTGQLVVTRMKPAPGIEGVELLQKAASAEQLSKHPVARAIVEVASRAKVRLSQPSQFQEAAGRGVSASIDGESILVGRAAWLAERDGNVRPENLEQPEGLSTLHVLSDGRYLGWLAMEDRTRPEAGGAIGELHRLGVRILMMVTGDRWSVARRVGQEMHCTDVHAEVLPEEKLAIVEQLKARGHCVVVVGDGVNDAPALAAGHLGIAMGAAGSDVAINSANIALMNNDLRRLPFLIRLSRATTRLIRQNLLFGVTFIVTLEILAATGYLPAMLAAVLHSAATALVIFNSARLVRFGEELQTRTPAQVPRRSQGTSDTTSRSAKPLLAKPTRRLALQDEGAHGIQAAQTIH